MSWFKKDRFNFERELNRAEKLTIDAAKKMETNMVHKMPKKYLPQWLWALLLCIVLGFFFVLGIFAAWASVISIPSINSFENRKIAESTKIYDRTGNVVLYDVHGSVRRT